MRIGTTLLGLTVALALSACTSGQPSPDGTGTGSGEDDVSSSTRTDAPPATGWLCDAISPQVLRTLAGGELTEPRQVQVQDDEVRWVCEAHDGQTPLVRLSLEPGEEARDAARDRVSDVAGVEDGPEHLGESYAAPGLVVGLTLCRDPEVADVGAYQHLTMTAESLVESEEDLSRPLLSTLTQAAQQADQRYGCSPRLARSTAEATSSP